MESEERSVDAAPDVSDGYPEYRLFSSLIFQVNRLASLYFKTASRDYQRQFGMGVPEVRLLNIIGGMPWASAQEVVETSSMDKGLVSRAMGTLIDGGYLRRQQDGKDRRRSTLELTEAGEQLYRRIRSAKERRHRRTLSGMTPEECRTLYRLLAKATTAAQQMTEDTAEAGKSPDQEVYAHTWPATKLLRRVRQGPG